MVWDSYSLLSPVFLGVSKVPQSCVFAPVLPLLQLGQFLIFISTGLSLYNGIIVRGRWPSTLILKYIESAQAHRFAEHHVLRGVVPRFRKLGTSLEEPRSLMPLLAVKTHRDVILRDSPVGPTYFHFG